MAQEAFEVVNTRVFEVRRETLFDAFADPLQLAVWWGPSGFTNSFSEFDLRKGGRWRFVMRSPDGREFANESIFEEVARPEKIVFLHEQPVHAFRMTMLFDALGPKSRLTWRMEFEREDRRLQSVLYAMNEQNFYRLEMHLRSR